MRNSLFIGPVVACLLALHACSSSSPGSSAPVDDRGIRGSLSRDVLPQRPPPGFQNAGKPGFYTVQPGDTLLGIARGFSQAPKDLVTWNELANPNLIEVGQVLRVAPPPTPVAASTASPSSVPIPAVPAAPGVAANATTPTAPALPTPPAPAASDIVWKWPAEGVVVGKFDEAKSKGIDIVGAAGSPIFAAADGVVVVAGIQRGYGNLIVIKHNDSVLSAYAHNQSLSVKEGQSVKAGQKIAEMGAMDTDKVKLHFQIRRDTKPVDPGKLLPPR